MSARSPEGEYRRPVNVVEMIACGGRRDHGVQGSRAIAVAAVVAITAVVWLIMSVRSPRLRAVLYSLPIPITIALLAGSSTRPGGQYLGVVLLVAFMYAVALLEPRLGRIWSVATSLFGYVAIAVAVHRWIALSAGVAFGVSTVALAIIWFFKRQRPLSARESSDQVRPGAVEYAAVPVVTMGIWVLGSVLGPFLITFPYSGVPTALAIRSGRLLFAANFANQAWLLLGFLGLFHVLRADLTKWAALGLAWMAFLLVSALVNRVAAVRQPPRSTPH